MECTKHGSLSRVGKRESELEKLTKTLFLGARKPVSTKIKGKSQSWKNLIFSRFFFEIMIFPTLEGNFFQYTQNQSIFPTLTLKQTKFAKKLFCKKIAYFFWS